jgi:hypothetical protein
MKQKSKKKGAIWISAVLYLLISVLIMVIVLQVGLPVIDSMRDESVIQNMQNQMITIDDAIRDVSDQEVGSRRKVTVDLQEGSLQAGEDRLSWDMQTEQEIVDQRLLAQRDNLYVSGATDVSAYEYNDSYIIKNSIITLNLSKCEAENNCTEITDIFNSVSQTKNTNLIAEEDFSVYYKEGVLFEGPGYSRLVTKGEAISHAIVEYHLRNPALVLEITLTGYTDYVSARLYRE